MKSIIEELKYNFKRKDNGLIKIILINIVVFVVLSLIYVFSKLFQNEIVLNFVLENLVLPTQFSRFIFKPWTILTYFFSHQDVFHILFNLLSFYWFGNIIVEYLGNRRLISIYLYGGIFAGLLFLTLFNFIPFFIQSNTFGLLGASGAIYAVIVAAAVLVPDYTFFMIFFGPVKIKYLAAIMIFISVIGSVESNAGGNIAHLGGALVGYLFIRFLKQGTDIGKPISAIGDFFNRISSPRPNMKVTYKNTNHQKNVNTILPNQQEIDNILDKINRSGYESLTNEEKQKLFKASQK
ncbi:MAG: rhomboid family intramembrane serine protease [Cytophagales bacterium]|nr:MAG: rhomboid family intramembrane serine protease [Cytophagales bacterium]